MRKSLVLACVIALTVLAACCLPFSGASAREVCRFSNVQTDSYSVPRGGYYRLTASILKTFSGGTVSGLWFTGELYKDGELYSTVHQNVTLRNTTTTSSLALKTDPNDPDATYSIVCKMEDGDGGGQVYDTKTFSGLTVTDYLLAIRGVQADRNVCRTGDTVTWKTDLGNYDYSKDTAENQVASFTYKIRNLETGSVVHNGSGLGEAGSEYSYTFQNPGKYGLTASMERRPTSMQYAMNSDMLFDEAIVYVEDAAKPSVKSIRSTHRAIGRNGENTWFITAGGGVGPLQYQYRVFRDGSLLDTSEWTEETEYGYHFDEAGACELHVISRDAAQTLSAEAVSDPLYVTESLQIDNIEGDALGYVNRPLVWTASLAGSASGAEYCWRVYRDNALVLTSEWSGSPDLSYTPVSAGTYRAEVSARNAEGENTGFFSGGNRKVTALPSLVTLKSYHTSIVPGETNRWQAKAAGGHEPIEYRFMLYQLQADGAKTLFRDFGWQKSNYLWSESLLDGGDYLMTVSARDAGGSVTDAMETGLEVIDHVPGLTGIELPGSFTLTDGTEVAPFSETGSDILWEITGIPGDGETNFRFTVKKDDVTVYTSEWLTAASYNYIGTWSVWSGHDYPSVGTYEILVAARDADGDVSNEVSFLLFVYDKLKIDGTVFSTEYFVAGQPYTVTALVSGGKEPYRYTFQSRYKTAGIALSYFTGDPVSSDVPSMTYMEEYPCNIIGDTVYHQDDYYEYIITVTDSNGSHATYTSPRVVIHPGPMAREISVDRDQGIVGESAAWSVRVDSYDQPMTCHFTLYRGEEACAAGEAQVGSDFAPVFTHVFEEAGDYTLSAYVEDGTYTSPTITGGALSVADLRPVVTAIVSENRETAPGTVNTWTVAAGGYGTGFSCFCRLLRNGTVYRNLGWREDMVFSCGMDEPGFYQAEVRVSNAEGYTSAFVSGGDLTVTCPGHAVVSDPAVPPTCTETGLTEGAHCSLCGEVLIAREVLAPLDHAWREPEYTWADNHQTVTAVRVCGRDGTHRETETADAAEEILKAAACETDGLARYSAAFNNPAFSSQTLETALPATGHAWDSVNYVWAEDYSSLTASRVCLHDESHTETETVSATVPRPSDISCMEGYVTDVESDAFENPAFEAQTARDVMIQPTGHSWSEPEYTWMDDCVYARHTCLRCGGEEEDCGALEYQVISSATCTEPETAMVYVSFRNPGFRIEPQIRAWGEPLGHLWEETAYIWSDDNSLVTATRVCRRAEEPHIETETAATVSQVTREATCEQKGETTWIAVFENRDFQEQRKTLENLDALGHAWGDPVYTWAEDHTKVTATRICSHDANHAETETAGASVKILAEPKCETEGSCRYISEAFENAAFEIRETEIIPIPAAGHVWKTQYIWSEDHRSLTAAAVCQRDSEHARTETVGTVRMLRKSPGDETEGSYAIESEPFEDTLFTAQTLEELTIPPLKSMNRLILPAGLKEVQEEAFAGGAYEAVIIPGGVTAIRGRAFADCGRLLYVRIPSSVTDISDDAFTNSPNVILDRADPQ